MPIFMDRHDVAETITAEMIAQIHQEDLKIQDQYGCRGLTYWFDEKRNTAFCLVEAPDAAAIHKMHDQAHGQVATRIIEVNADVVEAFLGRIEDPEKAPEAELNIIDDPALRIIMIVSLKQLKPTKHISAHLKTSLDHFNYSTIDIINTLKGNLVKQTENYFLVSFKSATDAFNAALKIQLLFKDLKRDISDEQVMLKIGLSAGLPVTQKKSFFEEPVKLAEWMCKIIKGEIIVSSEVRELYNSENLNPLGGGEAVFFLTETEEKFLTSLMDYAEDNWINTDLKIDDFSKALGCSISQLYRKMTSLTGKSANTFITEYRLNEALNLLNKNAGNISEIAFQTGFSSPSYFSKCFKKKYGRLPYEY